MYLYKNIHILFFFCLVTGFHGCQTGEHGTSDPATEIGTDTNEEIKTKTRDIEMKAVRTQESDEKSITREDGKREESGGEKTEMQDVEMKEDGEKSTERKEKQEEFRGKKTISEETEEKETEEEMKEDEDDDEDEGGDDDEDEDEEEDEDKYLDEDEYKYGDEYGDEFDYEDYLLSEEQFLRREHRGLSWRGNDELTPLETWTQRSRLHDMYDPFLRDDEDLGISRVLEMEAEEALKKKRAAIEEMKLKQQRLSLLEILLDADEMKTKVDRIKKIASEQKRKVKHESMFTEGGTSGMKAMESEAKLNKQRQLLEILLEEDEIKTKVEKIKKLASEQGGKVKQGESMFTEGGTSGMKAIDTKKLIEPLYDLEDIEISRALLMDAAELKKRKAPSEEMESGAKLKKQRQLLKILIEADEIKTKVEKIKKLASEQGAEVKQGKSMFAEGGTSGMKAIDTKKLIEPLYDLEDIEISRALLMEAAELKKRKASSEEMESGSKIKKQRQLLEILLEADEIKTKVEKIKKLASEQGREVKQGESMSIEDDTSEEEAMDEMAIDEEEFDLSSYGEHSAEDIAISKALEIEAEELLKRRKASSEEMKTDISAERATKDKGKQIMTEKSQIDKGKQKLEMPETRIQSPPLFGIRQQITTELSKQEKEEYEYATLRLRLFNMFDRGFNSCHHDPKILKESQTYEFDTQYFFRIIAKTEIPEHSMHGMYFESLVRHSEDLEQLLAVMHAKYMALKFLTEHIICALSYTFAQEQEKAENCKMLAYYFAWFAELSTKKIISKISILMYKKDPEFLKNFVDSIMAYQTYEKIMIEEKLPLLQLRNINTIEQLEEKMQKPGDPKGKWVVVQGESSQSTRIFSQYIQSFGSSEETRLQRLITGDLQKHIEKIRRFNLISGENPAIPHSNEYMVKIQIYDKLSKIIHTLKNADPWTEDRTAVHSNVIDIMRQIELQKGILRRAATRQSTEALIAANRNLSVEIIPYKEDNIFPSSYYKRLQKHMKDIAEAAKKKEQEAGMKREEEIRKTTEMEKKRKYDQIHAWQSKILKKRLEDLQKEQKGDEKEPEEQEKAPKTQKESQEKGQQEN